MENVNLHKQRLYALIIAGVAFISLLLPWQSYSFQGFGGFGGAGSGSITGFNGWGWLSLLGIIGVIVASLMGDKTKVYDDNTKKIALAGFALVIVGAVIFLIRVIGAGNQLLKSSPGFGLIICLIVGALGCAWVAGLVKLPDLPKSTTPPAPPTPTPPPPTPPTPPAS